MSKDKINILDVVPVRRDHILFEAGADGCVVLAYLRFKKAWMQRWLLPKRMSPYVHVPLEVHGTAVWNAIDGKSTVGELIAGLAAHFEGEKDYESRVVTYLMQLRKDGFISFCMAEKA